MLPQLEQLTKYAERTILKESENLTKRIVALTECGKAYADTYFNIKEVGGGIPVVHKSWKDIYHLSGKVYTDVSRKEKQLIEELQKYIRNVMPIQNKNSNWVYVVSISTGNPNGWSLSWRDIVEKRRRYFHPVGKGWPKTPPNYIAFRYDGKLQSIHHIESYELTHRPADFFPEASDEIWPDKSFIYHLGEPVLPAKEIRSGNIWNQRMYCMIDTLLTANTIKDAYEESKQRAETIT